MTQTKIPGFRVSPAKRQDAALVLSFIRELADYERLGGEVTATEEQLAEELFGERPSAEALIGYLREEPVAFALFFHNFSTFRGSRGLYLEDLFVRPHARGQGIGRAMLNILAEIARSRRCARFEWAVLDWNAPAIAFYRSLGAKPMEEWTIFRLEGDALERVSRGADPRII